MMHKVNVEQLENKMKLLGLNFEEFNSEKMVHMYTYVCMCNIIAYAFISSYV